MTTGEQGVVNTRESASEHYLVYCLVDKKVAVLGPLFAAHEQAQREVMRLQDQGWDARWVGLSDLSRWIVT